MKKRKISYKKIFIFILILDVLVFGTVKTVSFVKEKFSNHKVEKYLASSETSIKLYSLDFTESIDIVRGTKVEEYEKKVTNKDTNEVYTKIKYNDKDYLLKEDVVTKDDVKDVVLETKKYVRTNVTVYKDNNNVDILSYFPKGKELEIVGYDKLNSDGTVSMYKVTADDTTGYVYSKYLVDTVELAEKNYDEEGNYVIHSTKLADPYRVGMAGNLDFYPNEKPKFEDNVMPETVKSLYLNVAAIKDPDSYIKVANDIGANAFVVDIKDGGLAYESETAKEYAPTAYKYANDTKENFKNNVKKLKDAGFYLIARIVVFNDTHYAQDHKEDVIVYKANGALFGGQYWLSPYCRSVWEYNVKLALESIEMGFNEVQFDYVRFPDRTTSVNDQLDFRDKYGESKAQAVQNFLMYAADEIHKKNVYLSADVFGESAGNYVTGYGQYWPAISNVVDVISGMPYPDHFNAHAYGIKEIVWTVPEKLMTSWGKDVAERQKTIETPAIVRTWIQAYNAIHSPNITYGDEQIKAQIKGLYNNGLTGGWMTWNSGSNISKYASFTTAFKVNYE